MAHQREKLERLRRYISRPAVSEQRLSLTPSGNVRDQLKTPYRDGTTHVIFEPLDFVACFRTSGPGCPKAAVASGVLPPSSGLPCAPHAILATTGDEAELTPLAGSRLIPGMAVFQSVGGND